MPTGDPHQPTEKERFQVTVLVANGLTETQIGVVLGISRECLRNHFSKELADGFTMILSMISTKLVQRALQGDKACMIFWLKTKAQWQETATVQLTGANGGPVDVRNVSTEELLKLLSRTEEDDPERDEIEDRQAERDRASSENNSRRVDPPTIEGRFNLMVSDRPRPNGHAARSTPPKTD